MATETADRRQQHVRSVTVTSAAALFGIVAAFVSAFLTGDMAPAVAAKNQQAQLVVVLAILVQLPLYSLSPFYDEGEFGAKDALFVAFMTFSMWFVTWGILLETGVTF